MLIPDCRTSSVVENIAVIHSAKAMECVHSQNLTEVSCDAVL